MHVTRHRRQKRAVKQDRTILVASHFVVGVSIDVFIVVVLVVVFGSVADDVGTDDELDVFVVSVVSVIRFNEGFFPCVCALVVCFVGIGLIVLFGAVGFDDKLSFFVVLCDFVVSVLSTFVNLVAVVVVDCSGVGHKSKHLDAVRHWLITYWVPMTTVLYGIDRSLLIVSKQLKHQTAQLMSTLFLIH